MRFPSEPLTPEEARALIHAPSLRAATGVRNRALLAVMYGAGLRCSEALALRTIDIDPDEHSVRVLHGKGDQSRTIGIDAGALVHVVRWIDRRKALGITGRVLMCTLKGTPVSDRYARAMVKRMAARAGIERRAHPHGLRHTHAVELSRSGFTVPEIQRQLGHRSLQTTQVYLDHIAPTELIAKVGARREFL